MQSLPNRGRTVVFPDNRRIPVRFRRIRRVIRAIHPWKGNKQHSANRGHTTTPSRWRRDSDRVLRSSSTLMTDGCIRALVEAIHSSPTQAVLHLSGGASQVSLSLHINTPLHTYIFNEQMKFKADARYADVRSWSFEHGSRMSYSVLQNVDDPTTRQG